MAYTRLERTPERPHELVCILEVFVAFRALLLRGPEKVVDLGLGVVVLCEFGVDLCELEVGEVVLAECEDLSKGVLCAGEVSACTGWRSRRGLARGSGRRSARRRSTCPGRGRPARARGATRAASRRRCRAGRRRTRRARRRASRRRGRQCASLRAASSPVSLLNVYRDEACRPEEKAEENPAARDDVPLINPLGRVRVNTRWAGYIYTSVLRLLQTLPICGESESAFRP